VTGRAQVPAAWAAEYVRALAPEGAEIAPRKQLENEIEFHFHMFHVEHFPSFTIRQQRDDHAPVTSVTARKHASCL
jgi:hypothetical protein